MSYTGWFAGTSTKLFFSACCIAILCMMIFMAVRLYRSYRRHPVYRTLILVLTAATAHQLLLLSGADSVTASPLLQLVTRLIGIVSFIIINFVFMKLYTHPSARLRGLPFILMGSAALLITGLEILFNPMLLDSTSQGRIVPLIGLDFFGILANFLILLDTRSVDMRTQYSASLIVYFAADLARVTDRYVFQGSVPPLLLLSRLLPVIYFSLLFLLLFQWVIDRLLITYRSSITDGLTGLYNRKHFQQKALQLLSRDKGIAIIFGDIDNFKRLNDTQGHHRADEVLKQISDMMREMSQDIGAAGRYGGEELLLVVGARNNAEELAEQLRRRIEQETIVTMSIGVSYSRPGMTVEGIIKQADEAMYRSKTSGKNRVTVTGAPGRTKRAKKAVP